MEGSSYTEESRECAGPLLFVRAGGEVKEISRSQLRGVEAAINVVMERIKGVTGRRSGVIEKQGKANNPKTAGRYPSRSGTREDVGG